MGELPEGWDLAALPTAFDLIPGHHGMNIKDDTLVSFVPMTKIEEKTGKINASEVRPYRDVKKNFSRFIEGDVIFAKITPCMENAKIALASGLKNRVGCGTTELHVFRPKNDNQARYLLYFLLQDSLRSQAKERFQGTSGHLRVPISFFEELQIPLPPPPEQRRIVQKLDQLMPKLEACRARLDTIPGLLKRFRQAVLAAAFSSRLTEDWRKKHANAMPPIELLKQLTGSKFNDFVRQDAVSDLPNSWPLVKTEALFSFVTSGSRGWAKYYAENGHLFLRIGNLDHASISLDLRSIQHVKPPKSVEGKRTRVQPSDILISITADVGMIALVPSDFEEAYVNQHISLARPHVGFSHEYLAWYLASAEGGLLQFQELQRGATKVGLGLDDIKNVWVPFPPIEEQREIIRRVESLFKKADAIQDRYEKARPKVDKLPQSVLAKAFRKEL